MLRAGGGSLESIAAKFGLHRDQVWRHWHRHVTAERKAQYIAGPVQLNELAERAAAEGLSLIDYLAIMRSTLLMLFSNAAGEGDAKATAWVSGRLLDVLKQIGKLTGELAASGVNIINNTMIMNAPEITEMQAVIIGALAPYPEARAAVVAALRQFEREGAEAEEDGDDAGTGGHPGPMIEGTAAGIGGANGQTV